MKRCPTCHRKIDLINPFGYLLVVIVVGFVILSNVVQFWHFLNHPDLTL